MFQFYFTFADGLDQSSLKIERDGDNFNWTFRPHCDCSSESMVLSEFGVYDNLRNIFNLLHYNMGAYSHFEFFAPGFPRVVVNMCDAFSAMPYIEYTMFSLIRNTQTAESQSENIQSMSGRPIGYFAEEANTVEDNAEEAEEAEEAEDADDEAEAEDSEDEADDDSEDEEYNSDDQYADMPPLISLDQCPCTPSRKTSRECPPLPRRFVVNEILDDGPCKNTRSAKSRRLNSSERVPSHLFFD